MKLTTTFFQKILLFGIISGLAFTLSSCDDDDDNGGGSGKKINAEGFFISVMGEKAEYIMLAENVESGQMSINENIEELELSGYTWIFNTDPSSAIGLIYQKGDPGVGLAYGIGADTTLQQKGKFEITTRFTSYGFFENYAITSVGGQVLEGYETYEDGSDREDGVIFNFIDLDTHYMTQRSIQTYNITGNGEQATLSGIVDMGNGEFLTGLVVSQARDENATGGSSSGDINYPDSVWVAAFDANLNLKRIYRDDRISYSSGRYRSQYYSQIGKADDGSVYVFSGSYDYNSNATSKACGALKINKNAEEFDSDYYFNIEDESDGYRFRKVWHITGDYFLLEFYNHIGRLTDIDDPASQYAVVNMKSKSFTWLKNFPDKNSITSTGLPMAYNGKMYFPVTTTDEYPTIYVIDPVTANASKGLVIDKAASIRAIGRLVN